MVVVYAPTDVMFPFVVANRSGVTYLLGSMDICAIRCNEIFDTYAYFCTY